MDCPYVYSFTKGHKTQTVTTEVMGKIEGGSGDLLPKGGALISISAGNLFFQYEFEFLFFTTNS